jgi:NAD(P)-dependent dehydrogenase (short-subunit alcohol dehydrogenase family)
VARSLEGQRVVIVGASAGIGRELAHRAIGEGAKVILAARRLPQLETLVQEADGGIPVVVDICDLQSCADFAERVRAELGAADLMICSAGYSPLRYMHEVTAADWQRVLGVNVIGIHQLIQSVLPVMNPGGLIGVMSSESTLQPRDALGVYTSSKAALEMSLRVWRQEQSSVRLTTLVVGGTFPTEFGADFDVDRLIPAMQSWGRHGTLQEKLMTPQDVAATIAGTLAAIIDLPDVSLDTVVIRSPTAVVGGSEHLEADAADNIAQVNESRG